MTFSYPVLTDEQIEAQRKTLEPGVYPFEVTDAESGTSKASGNPMITLTIKVWDQHGSEFTIKDYLVGSSAMSFKIKNFWHSVGKPEKYLLGANQDYDFKRQSGKVKTKLEKEQNGSRMFPRVADYIYEEPGSSIVESNAQNATLNDVPEDDIPF